MSANEVANMMAPPTPCTARARLSMRDESERPQTSDETVKMMSPTANILRRPNMSPNTPAVRRKAARVSE